MLKLWRKSMLIHYGAYVAEGSTNVFTMERAWPVHSRHVIAMWCVGLIHNLKSSLL
jgi:hypothetical protein